MSSAETNPFPGAGAGRETKRKVETDSSNGAPRPSSSSFPAAAADGVVLKKPKLEPSPETTDWECEDEDEEAAAVEALVAHRVKEVEHYKMKILQYEGKLDEAEKALVEANELGARFRARYGAKSSAGSVEGNGEAANRRRQQPSVPLPPQRHVVREASVAHPPVERLQLPARPELVVPSGKSKLPTKQELVAPPPPTIGKAPAASLPSSLSSAKQGEKKEKRKIEQQIESENLIPCIASSSSATLRRFHTSALVSSQHKRKLRCLELCPTKDSLFVTSALDGVVNLWQLMPKGPTISMLSSTDCLTSKDRRWPEDLAWHPDGDRIFSVYSADGGDVQISVLNLNLSGQKKVAFLGEKPHIKGLINTINFMPWAADTSFVTGGSDHALFIWQEQGSSWKPKVIHRDLHSSAVMGVCGLVQKKTTLSVGADKRVIAFDLLAGRSEFKNQFDSKCMSILPNPTDFNLYMVQTGTPSKQLRLYDVRMRTTEVHAFGWKQSSSESQSALINQSWSPDGLCLSSGSMDPMIHIFDIRFSGSRPAQSVQAHQKRVFKAIWHQSNPFLTSISSDLHIGVHRVT